jgi:hypothetical protein
MMIENRAGKPGPVKPIFTLEVKMEGICAYGRELCREIPYLLVEA